MMREGSPGDREGRVSGREVAMLRSVPLFQDLTDEELETVLAVGKEIEYRAGDGLVEAGLRAMDFYLILEGEAELHVPGGRRERLGPGSAFGEISVLDGEPRSATVTATTRVLALRIGRPEFIPLLDRHGSVGRKILVEMGGRLRRAERAAREAREAATGSGAAEGGG